MLLAWMRYVLICRRNSWFYYRFSDKISKGSFFAIIAAIITPALIWTIIMYFGSPATGKFWVFRPGDSTSENESITVLQPIPDSVRHNAKPIVIVMALLVLVQLLLTLFFYIRICYASFMSTMNVNFKPRSFCSTQISAVTGFHKLGTTALFQFEQLSVRGIYVVLSMTFDIILIQPLNTELCQSPLA